MLVQLLEKIMSLSVKEKMEVNTADILLRSDNVNVVDLEKYADKKRRYHAAFESSLISGFVDYFNKKDNNKNAVVTLDHNKLRAKAVFDSIDNGHCVDTALLDARYTSEFSAYRGVASSGVMSQREAIDWFEDFQHVIPDAIKIVAALRKLEAKREGSRSQEATTSKESTSIMESVELKGSELPDQFEFQFVPTLGLSSHTVSIRLRIKLDHEPMRVILKPVNFDAVMEWVADDFKNHLSEQIDHDRVFIGSISFN